MDSHFLGVESLSYLSFSDFFQKRRAHRPDLALTHLPVFACLTGAQGVKYEQEGKGGSVRPWDTREAPGGGRQLGFGEPQGGGRG